MYDCAWRFEMHTARQIAGHFVHGGCRNVQETANKLGTVQATRTGREEDSPGQ